MSVMNGTYSDGRVQLAGNPDWPDGTPVRVEPVAADEPVVGMREEDWPTTPEAIEAWVAAVEALEPVMTPEEDAAWRQARAEQKAWEFAHRDEYDAKIRRLFE